MQGLQEELGDNPLKSNIVGRRIQLDIHDLSNPKVWWNPNSLHYIIFKTQLNALYSLTSLWLMHPTTSAKNQILHSQAAKFHHMQSRVCPHTNHQTQINQSPHLLHRSCENSWTHINPQRQIKTKKFRRTSRWENYDRERISGYRSPRLAMMNLRINDSILP